jgi:hypothetical protein
MKGQAMAVLQIELGDQTEEGWPIHVTFHGKTRGGLLYQRAGLSYRLPDGTVAVPKPSWWLRTRDPVSDEWLGDVDDHFLNNVGAAVRRVWGSEIDEWCPEMQPKPSAAREDRLWVESQAPIASVGGETGQMHSSGSRLLPRMPPPEHTRRKS